MQILTLIVKWTPRAVLQMLILLIVDTQGSSADVDFNRELDSQDFNH